MVDFGFNSAKGSESTLGQSGEFSEKFQRIGTSILYGYLDYLTTTSRVIHGEESSDKFKNNSNWYKSSSKSVFNQNLIVHYQLISSSTHQLISSSSSSLS